MEIQTLQRMREKVEDNQLQSPSLPPAATHSPPSASSSPSHDFSFTISLHPQPPNKINQDKYLSNNNKNIKPNTTTTTTPPFAIDLSPADDIFFHGHLLPLHLLSHLPVSPRSSTNSMDSFILPIKDLIDDENTLTTTTTTATSFQENRRINSDDQMKGSSRTKSKTFSFFRRRKGCSSEEREREDRERNNYNYKKKLKYEVSQVVKRYMRMVRPLLSFTGLRTRSNTEFHRQPYSFSGNLTSRSLPDYWSGAGRRGEFSAPASMRTSPANSGLLVASGTVSPIKPTSDSTMEELQAAIQAAIAHCKNSISMEDKIQCKD